MKCFILTPGELPGHWDIDRLAVNLQGVTAVVDDDNNDVFGGLGILGWDAQILKFSRITSRLPSGDYNSLIVMWRNLKQVAAFVHPGGKMALVPIPPGEKFKKPGW